MGEQSGLRETCWGRPGRWEPGVKRRFFEPESTGLVSSTLYSPRAPRSSGSQAKQSSCSPTLTSAPHQFSPG